MEREQDLADVWEKVKFIARTTDQNGLPLSLILEPHSIPLNGRIHMGI